MISRIVRVFLNPVPVARRDGGHNYWKAEWVARGHGTIMYVTPTVLGREVAVDLAMAYLAKHPEYEDTTRFP